MKIVRYTRARWAAGCLSTCALLLSIPQLTAQLPPLGYERMPIRHDGHVLIYHPRPSYPYEARTHHPPLVGHGVAALYVGTDGAVHDVKLVQSTGYKVLDEEVVRAFKKWKFQPEKAAFIAHVPWDFEMDLKLIPPRHAHF